MSLVSQLLCLWYVSCCVFGRVSGESVVVSVVRQLLCLW